MNKSYRILWVASLILAFSTGFFIRPEGISSFNSSIVGTSDNAEYKPKTASSAINRPKKNRIDSVLREIVPETKINVVAEIKRLLGNSRGFSDLASIAESYSLVSGLTEQEAIKALNDLKYGLNDPNGLLPFNLVISRYAEIDANAALNFIENNVSSALAKKTAITSAIATWSKSDPTSAYYWILENNSDSSGERGVLSGTDFFPVFNGLAKQSADDAFAKLSELAADNKNISMAVAGMAGALHSKDQFASFYQKSKDLKDNNVGGTIMRSWTNKNPREAADWANSVEDDAEKDELQGKVLETWMNTEPREAADWYLASSSQKTRQRYADNIINNWSYRSPKSALGWIQEQGNIDAQKTTRKLLEISAFGNTKFAIDNLYLLDNDEDKRGVSNYIYSSLKRENKSKANDFLNNSPYKEYIAKLNAKKRSKKR